MQTTTQIVWVLLLCWTYESEKERLTTIFEVLQSLYLEGLEMGWSWMRSVDQTNLSQISVNAQSAHLILPGMVFNTADVFIQIYAFLTSEVVMFTLIITKSISWFTPFINLYFPYQKSKVL